jgi:hypothetical protein
MKMREKGNNFKLMEKLSKKMIRNIRVVEHTSAAAA